MKHFKLLNFTFLSMLYSVNTYANVSGTCNSSGTCLWEIDSSGTLTVSAAEGTENVSMDDYVCEGASTCSALAGNRPWEDYIKQIQNIVIEDKISKIGKNAFQNASNVKTVSGMKDVKEIPYDSFFYCTALQSVEMPNVEIIGTGAFTSVPSGAVILYQGTAPINCTSSSNLPANNIFVGTNFQGTSLCGKTVKKCDGFVKSAECVSDCGSGYLGKEMKCINDTEGCGTGYVLKDNTCIREGADCGAGYAYDDIYNECLRKRYTLPEADAATSDDNENMIEWIFE
ncbi:MAG: leucine-rich repeat protein [Alphaproteobacteria bacterium]|nr:leucine-rich repeat protein [Alphaproteobacteria bacterium]